MSELTGKALLRLQVPDEFQDKLAQVAFNWKKDKFLIGDIRNSIKGIVGERMLPVSTPDIDDFIADCLNHEIEPRTVRYYAMLVDAFPIPVRDAYSILSHAHFAFAHSFAEDERIKVLDLARDRTEITGKVPSVDWLRAAYSGYIYERQSGDFPAFSGDLTYAEPTVACADEPAEPEPKEEPRATGWLSGLQRAVRFGIEHIEAVPLDSEQRMELLNLLARVDTLLGQYIMV